MLLHEPSRPVQVESAEASRPTGDEQPSRVRIADELEAALRTIGDWDSASDNPDLLCRVYGLNCTTQSVRSVTELWGAPKSRLSRMLVRAPGRASRAARKRGCVAVPVLVTERRGQCAACALVIEQGEVITYERAGGAPHMACAYRPADRRRNLYPAHCELCGVRLMRHVTPGSRPVDRVTATVS
jgi:hypothetical protein